MKLLKRLRLQKNAEELIKLAKENDIILTAEKAEEYFIKLSKNGELYDDELDNVAGGKGGYIPDPYESGLLPSND